MAGLDDFLKSDVTKGVAIGFGIAASGLLIAPALRPIARVAIKTGILCFEKGREKMAEAGEAFEDLVAEVRAELAEERSIAESVAETAADAAAETAGSHD
jgi:hypothetical protein